MDSELTLHGSLCALSAQPGACLLLKRLLLLSKVRFVRADNMPSFLIRPNAYTAPSLLHSIQLRILRNFIAISAKPWLLSLPRLRSVATRWAEPPISVTIPALRLYFAAIPLFTFS